MWGDWNDPRDDDERGLPPLPLWMREEASPEDAGWPLPAPPAPAVEEPAPPAMALSVVLAPRLTMTENRPVAEVRAEPVPPSAPAPSWLAALTASLPPVATALPPAAPAAPVVTIPLVEAVTVPLPAAPEPAFPVDLAEAGEVAPPLTPIVPEVAIPLVEAVTVPLQAAPEPAFEFELPAPPPFLWGLAEVAQKVDRPVTLQPFTPEPERGAVPLATSEPMVPPPPTTRGLADWFRSLRPAGETLPPPPPEPLPAPKFSWAQLLHRTPPLEDAQEPVPEAPPVPAFLARLADQVADPLRDEPEPEPEVSLPDAPEPSFLTSFVTEPEAPADPWEAMSEPAFLSEAAVPAEEEPELPAPVVLLEPPALKEPREARLHLEAVMQSLDAALAEPKAGEAAPAPVAPPVVEESRFVVFFLEGVRWAVPIADVLEMGTVPRITPLPNVPGFVRGVTNLRGEVLAVIDLRAVLGFEPGPDPSRERMLVVKAPGREAVGGFIVDGVRGLARLAPGTLAPPSLPAGERVGQFLRGVSGHDGALLNVLDTRTLFDTPEMLKLAAG